MASNDSKASASESRALTVKAKRPATGSAVVNRMIAAYELARRGPENPNASVVMIPNGELTKKGDVKETAVSFPGVAGMAQDGEPANMAFEQLAEKDIFPVLIRHNIRVNAYGVKTKTPVAVCVGAVIRTLAGIDDAEKLTDREKRLEKEALQTGKSQQ